MDEFECRDWDPDPRAFSRFRREDPAGEGSIAVSIRHPTHPFSGTVATGADFERSLRAVAHAYLVALVERLDTGIPAQWLLSLAPSAEIDAAAELVVAWLDSAPRTDEGADSESPFFPDPVSHWCARTVDGERVDETLVLIATEHIDARPLAHPVGLRVALHVRPGASAGSREVRITSLSAWLRPGVDEATRVAVALARDPETRIDIFNVIKTLNGRYANDYLGFEPDTALLRSAGIWPARDAESSSKPASKATSKSDPGAPLADTGSSVRIELSGWGTATTPGPRREADRARYEYRLAVRLSFTPFRADLVAAEKSPLVAGANCGGAAGHARVFPRDPVSQAPHAPGGVAHTVMQRRPSRSAPALDEYRTCVDFTGLHEPLRYQTNVEVLQTRHVHGDNHGAPKSVPLPVDGSGAVPDVRSDDASAIQGLFNPAGLFLTLARLGFEPATLFRFAALPLEVYYRSGVRPGPGKDGQSVNAQVKVQGWKPGQVSPDPSSPFRPPLELHLALASRFHRARRRASDGRSVAEPLGIGADPRWMWHEFAHALLMATVGELELRFAHSPGDALAAIVADPHSDLAAPQRDPWRGATFPWVFVNRRHDRSVVRGWSWSGTMHQALRDLSDAGRRVRRKGYRSEQILSTTLFQLYRCLGGDTIERVDDAPADVGARALAADHSVYLIVRALWLLGDARVAPANDPDQLVSALIDADLATEQLDLALPDGAGEARIGGCAHKAIRWAFEAQGLYADTASALSSDPGPGAGTRIHNAPGDPPPVDVFVRDRRTTTESAQGIELDYGPGSYRPVSLDAPSGGNCDSLPGWFAADDAIVVGSDGRVGVTVGNRGLEAAEAVTVRVWICRFDTSLPEWQSPDQFASSPWTPLSPSPPTQSVAPGETASFDGFELGTLEAARYLILAEVTCAADRANTDFLTGFACTRLSTPLAQLVANDNNLGLRCHVHAGG